jgi:hypothetical protein
LRSIHPKSRPYIIPSFPPPVLPATTTISTGASLPSSRTPGIHSSVPAPVFPSLARIRSYSAFLVYSSHVWRYVQGIIFHPIIKKTSHHRYTHPNQLYTMISSLPVNYLFNFEQNIVGLSLHSMLHLVLHLVSHLIVRLVFSTTYTLSLCPLFHTTLFNDEIKC